MLFSSLFDNWKNIILFILIVIILGLILISINNNMDYKQSVDYFVETPPVIIPNLIRKTIKNNLLAEEEPKKEESVMKKISDTINKTIVGVFPLEIIKEAAKEKEKNIIYPEEIPNRILKQDNINRSNLPRDDIPSSCESEWSGDEFDIDMLIMDTRKDKTKTYFY
jgi:hypothetical protein